jgi:hypothetical protein
LQLEDSQLEDSQLEDLQFEDLQLEDSHLAALQLFEIERLAVLRSWKSTFSIRELTEPPA